MSPTALSAPRPRQHCGVGSVRGCGRSLGVALGKLQKLVGGTRSRYRMLTVREALLLLLNAAVLPPMLWISSWLLRAASILLLRSSYHAAALIIFFNNLMAAAIVALVAFTVTELAWVWLLSSGALSRSAGRAAVAFATSIFAISLYLRRGFVKPILFLLPHFWLEYAALTAAAYAGFKRSAKALALSAALLASAAPLEVAIAALAAGR